MTVAGAIPLPVRGAIQTDAFYNPTMHYVTTNQRIEDTPACQRLLAEFPFPTD
jgi:hypothetical protein